MEDFKKEFNKLLDDKKEQIFESTKKKIRDYKIFYLLLELIFIITGITILFYNNYWIGVGVWLYINGTNMGLNRQINRAKNKKIGKIWEND